MKTTSQIYTQMQAQGVCLQCIERGQSFRAEPLPCDIWEIEVKDEGPPLPEPVSPSGTSFNDWVIEVERCIGTNEPLSKTGRGDFLFPFLRGLSPAEAVQADRAPQEV